MNDTTYKVGGEAGDHIIPHAGRQINVFSVPLSIRVGRGGATVSPISGLRGNLR